MSHLIQSNSPHLGHCPPGEAASRLETACPGTLPGDPALRSRHSSCHLSSVLREAGSRATASPAPRRHRQKSQRRCAQHQGQVQPPGAPATTDHCQAHSRPSKGCRQEKHLTHLCLWHFVGTDARTSEELWVPRGRAPLLLPPAVPLSSSGRREVLEKAEAGRPWVAQVSEGGST